MVELSFLQNSFQFVCTGTRCCGRCQRRWTNLLDRSRTSIKHTADSEGKIRGCDARIWTDTLTRFESTCFSRRPNRKFQSPVRVSPSLVATIWSKRKRGKKKLSPKSQYKQRWMTGQTVHATNVTAQVLYTWQDRDDTVCGDDGWMFIPFFLSWFLSNGSRDAILSEKISGFQTGEETTEIDNLKGDGRQKN